MHDIPRGPFIFFLTESQEQNRMIVMGHYYSLPSDGKDHRSEQPNLSGGHTARVEIHTERDS